jgi:hypothetical protein
MTERCENPLCSGLRGSTRLCPRCYQHQRRTGSLPTEPLRRKGYGKVQVTFYTTIETKDAVVRRLQPNESLSEWVGRLVEREVKNG